MLPKAFSKIWAVVIIAAVLAGGILAWQHWWLPKEEGKTPEEIAGNETVDWKTYRNEEYGLEFKYPPKIEGMDGPIEEMWTSKTNNCLSGGFDYRFDFLNRFSMLVCYLGDETFQQWILRNDSGDIDEIEAVLEHAENIIIDGKQGIKIINPLGYPLGRTGYGYDIIVKAYFSDDSKIYTFAFYNSELTEEKEKLFNQILSTFKFLK